VNCSNIMIEDVDVEMISVPRKCAGNCRLPRPNKGLIITKGLR